MPSSLRNAPNISFKPPVMSRILDDPKKVKALIKSFQTETSSTRAQGGNVKFHLPLSCIMRLHVELASLVHFMYVTTMM